MTPTPSPPKSKPALGPCEYPECPDPKNESPEVWVHCVHDQSENLWPHTVPPTPYHHLMIRSLDTADPSPSGEACEACGGGGYATKDGKWGDPLCGKCNGHGRFFSCEGCEDTHGFGAGDYDTKVGTDYHVQELHTTIAQQAARIRELVARLVSPKECPCPECQNGREIKRLEAALRPERPKEGKP
jgi:hypothetical protein